MKPDPDRYPLDIDFEALDAEDLEAFLQPGSRGIPEQAASCVIIGHPASSCSQPPDPSTFMAD